MIIGEVNPRGEAIIRVRVHGPGQVIADVPAGLDTGFTESLCLNEETIAALGLPFLYQTMVQLGNGGFVRMNVYTGQVEWDRRRRGTLVHETEGDALIGVSLLKGFHVGIDMVDGGRVSLEPL